MNNARYNNLIDTWIKQYELEIPENARIRLTAILDQIKKESFQAGNRSLK